MRDILSDERLADSIRANQDDVGGLLEKVERHERFNGRTVTALGPLPVEVAERFEAADMGLFRATLQTAAGAFLFFPVEKGRDPAVGNGVWPVRQQTMQL